MRRYSIGILDEKFSQDWDLAKARGTVQRQDVQSSRPRHPEYQDFRCLQEDQQPEIAFAWSIVQLSWLGGFD